MNSIRLYDEDDYEHYYTVLWINKIIDVIVFNYLFLIIVSLKD